MEYPVVCNWVRYTEAENGGYYVFNELLDEVYNMCDDVFALFCRLDGETDPYTIQSSFDRNEVQVLLYLLEEDYLIRRSRVLLTSLGNIMITLWSVGESSVQKRVAGIADRLLSLLWLPVSSTGLLYMIRLGDGIWRSDGLVLGIVLGLITALVLHELAHAAACLHYGGSVYEFGVGFSIFLPCAYVLMNTDDIKSRRKRAHVNAAGIEMNLFLTGAFMILAYFLPSACGFMAYAAVQNAIMAFYNLLFITGMDGMHVISDLVGCDDLFEYAKATVFDRKKRRKLYHKGVNGIVTLSVCCIAMILQMGLPFLIALNFIFLIVE